MGCARLPRIRLLVSDRVLILIELTVAVFSAGESTALFATEAEDVNDNVVEVVDTEARVSDADNKLVVSVAKATAESVEVVEILILPIVAAVSGWLD